MNKKQLNKLSEFLKKIVQESSKITLKYFKARGIKSSFKKDNSPVTIADLKCENYLIKQIKNKYPSHNIFSEENGVQENGSEFKWIIDPIDGTRNYMRGYPYWGTLLALEFQREVVLGAVYMPALEEFIIAAKGMGTTFNGRKLQVSKCKKLENAYVIYGGLNYIIKSSYKEDFFKLISRCSHVRGFGDCHGYTFIMKGQAEIMVDPKVAPYDIAAVKICIEEAGGKLTSVTGINSIYEGTALATNGKIHNKAVKILNNKE